MKKSFGFLVAIFLFSNIGLAAEKCDFGGLQVALRDAADGLHSGNPVRFIDFADDAPFAGALNRMSSVGVQPSKVQAAWLDAIQDLCGERAGNLTADDFGPDQNLSGLMGLLGMKILE